MYIEYVWARRYHLKADLKKCEFPEHSFNTQFVSGFAAFVEAVASTRIEGE